MGNIMKNPAAPALVSNISLTANSILPNGSERLNDNKLTHPEHDDTLQSLLDLEWLKNAHVAAEKAVLGEMYGDVNRVRKWLAAFGFSEEVDNSGVIGRGASWAMTSLDCFVTFLLQQSQAPEWIEFSDGVQDYLQHQR